APSLQTRRLRLRNAHVNPSPLPSGAPYCHRPRISTGCGIPALPRKDLQIEGDDQDWESEDALGPEDGLDGALSPRGRRHRNRISASSLLSSASTLVNTPESGHQGRLSRNPSPSPKTSHLYVQRTNLRNRSNESGRKDARYIEYLERQVADLMNQLQGYTEATSTTSHAAKMRKLSSENRALRSELADWETNFSLRVNEEVAGKTSVDKTLRLSLMEMGMKLEQTEELCRVANIELKDLRKRCEELEGVEEENRSLEFRIETLSELLADSTGTTQVVIPSAAARRSSVTYPKRISSLGSNASNTSSKSAPDNRRVSRGSAGSLGGISDFGISDPIDSSMDHIYDNPYSPASSTASSPRHSHPPISFAPALPLSPTSSALKSRRMRRFPSGSSAPKTLILPSAVAMGSPTPSNQGLISLSGPSSRNVSRPGSSSSMMSGYENIQNNCHPSNSQMASLFAELTRAQEDHSHLGTADSHLGVPRPPSPTLSDTFNLVADALSNPAPLILKVLDSVEAGIAAPSNTFHSARRRAISILGRVVSPGIDRVSQKRARMLSAKTRERRRVVIPSLSAPPPPSLRARFRETDTCCKACGASKTAVYAPRGGHRKSIFDLHDRDGSATPTQSVTPKPSNRDGSRALALKQHQAIDATLDNLWLWVRFIIAVVVALGVAVKDGPAMVMHDDGEGIDHVREEERERALKRLERSAKG
ncbi:hypothetical protein EDC01DRAFT_594713, partial [Geopyxis carbonaria]